MRLQEMTHKYADFFSIFAQIFSRTHFFVDFRSILLKITKKTMTCVNTLVKQGFRAAQQAIKIFVFVDDWRRGRNFLEIYENQKFQGAICQCLLVFLAAGGGQIFCACWLVTAYFSARLTQNFSCL